MRGAQHNIAFQEGAGMFQGHLINYVMACSFSFFRVIDSLGHSVGLKYTHAEQKTLSHLKKEKS